MALARWRTPLVAVVAVFVATRVALLLFTVREREFILPSVTNDVRDIYSRWFDVLSTGSFPDNDVMWQYPPAAALVMLAPALLPMSYAVSFYWISFLVDVAVFVALIVAGRRGPAASERQPWAAWVWAVGVALGGPIAYGRYDLIVTGIAVLGLIVLTGPDRSPAADRRRNRLGGVILAVGALVKVWPAFLLLAAGPRRRWQQSWAAAVAAGLAILAAFWVSMPNAMAFLSHQGGRGVEVESIGALPFHVASHHGWDGFVALNYGSMEFIGPHVTLVARLSLLASLLGLAWLIIWRVTARHWRDSTTADAALVVVLLFVVTSRVISPQYMVWMVGLGAVCALHFGRRGESVMRLPVVLVLIATALTCVEYPYYFQELLASERGAVLLVTVRNVLLVAAALIGATRLWRSTRKADTGQADTGQADTQAGSRSRSQAMSER
ncbi:MAG: glycosyltransferase family 87 protein [Sporichthyaceae bacterium]